jgi:hypothetical protein
MRRCLHYFLTAAIASLVSFLTARTTAPNSPRDLVCESLTIARPGSPFRVTAGVGRESGGVWVVREDSTELAGLFQSRRLGPMLGLRRDGVPRDYNLTLGVKSHPAISIQDGETVRILELSNRKAWDQSP